MLYVFNYYGPSGRLKDKPSGNLFFATWIKIIFPSPFLCCIFHIHQALQCWCFRRNGGKMFHKKRHEHKSWSGVLRRIHDWTLCSKKPLLSCQILRTTKIKFLADQSIDPPQKNCYCYGTYSGTGYYPPYMPIHIYQFVVYHTVFQLQVQYVSYSAYILVFCLYYCRLTVYTTK